MYAKRRSEVESEWCNSQEHGRSWHLSDGSECEMKECMDE